MPGRVPAAGAYTAKIRKRGYLVAGVSADTLLFGSRNPIKKRIEGFDIDCPARSRRRIFGDENKIRFTVITAQRRTAEGPVDAKKS